MDALLLLHEPSPVVFLLVIGQFGLWSHSLPPLKPKTQGHPPRVSPTPYASAPGPSLMSLEVGR